METVVTHYCPKHRNRNAWITIEYLILFEKVSESLSSDDYLGLSLADDVFGPAKRRRRRVKPGIYYVTHGQGLGYEHPRNQEDFDRSNGYFWYSQQFLKLPKPVPYNPAKRLWLSPRGYLVYARINNPANDPTAVKVGYPPKQYRQGYAVDVRELRRQISKIGVTDPEASQMQRTLSDLQAVVSMLNFCSAYQLDPASISEEIEEAMPCLNQNAVNVLRSLFGESGVSQRDWQGVADAMSLSRVRVCQIYERSLRILKQRIRWNRTRKRLGLLVATGKSPLY